jgi:hypothetical protein
MVKWTADQITDLLQFSGWFSDVHADKFQTGLTLDASQVVVWLPHIAENTVETENSPEFWTWVFRVALLIRAVRGENSAEFSQPATVALHAKSENYDIITGLNEIVFALRCAGRMSRHHSAPGYVRPSDIVWVKKLAAETESGGDLNWFYANPLAIFLDKNFLKSTSVLSLRAILQNSTLKDGGLPIWWEWYEAIAQGRPAFGLNDRKTAEALERAITLGGKDGKFRKEFWEREPGAINADIAAWVAEARAAERVPADQSEIDLSSRPASVQTKTANGKVVLEQEHPDADIARALLAAAVLDLQNALGRLETVARQKNAPDALLLFFGEAALTVVEAHTDQSKLFESGRNLKTLQNYGSTVSAEWDTFGAAQYHALVLQFDEVIKKFPAWRAFEFEPPKAAPHTKPEDVAAVVDEVIAAISNTPDIVDATVVDRLRALKFRLMGVSRPMIDQAGMGGSNHIAIELLMSDAGQSTANVLMSVVKLGLENVAPMGNWVGGNLTAGLGMIVAGIPIAVCVVALPKLKKMFPGVFERYEQGAEILSKFHKSE